MRGCGRRGHPAVTHGPARPWDGQPQPDGAGGSHREQLGEEGVGDNPSSCQAPHLPATFGEEVTPWCAFERGASKTIAVPASARTCTPVHPQLFGTFLTTQPANPAERGSQCFSSSWGASVHPSVHPSVRPGNGLNRPCPTLRGQPGLPGMEGRGLQLGLITGQP